MFLNWSSMLSGVKVFNRSFMFLMRLSISVFKSVTALCMLSVTERFSGTVSSAAALGVEALKSAAKSLNAQSIS